ncbi:hypothetical protein E2C01_022065 [Portunus trituberculatus]|uniref:Uncharacterized protein n=1 Tax=Portunus trituberculatus TaxID=210409 RepID=A0A5B7E6N2_PORTR|nr:hypothetical protein [Portunus trituberculatus]
MSNLREKVRIPGQEFPTSCPCSCLFVAQVTRDKRTHMETTITVAFVVFPIHEKKKYVIFLRHWNCT